MSMPKFEYIVMTYCPRHGRTTVYDGCDEEEAQIAFRKTVKILREIVGCKGERVQFYRRPFVGELVAEEVDS
jgi:hypothetical protein